MTFQEEKSGMVSTPKKKRDPYILQIASAVVGKTITRELKGQIVAVSGRSFDERGFSLIPQPTRVLCKNEIHELVTTDEVDAEPNKTIGRAGVIGFFEVTQGSYVILGDSVSIRGKDIGKLAGFDETHLPNHINIVVLSPKRVSGLEAGFHIGDRVSIGSRP